MTTPAIGPVQAATIISQDYRASIDAWCEHLGQHIHSEVTVNDNRADRWGYSDLAGRRVTWLANDLNEPWLRIVESPNAELCDPFESYGWFSLEINVQDVDQLYEDLEDSPFKVIGKPANLDVSDSVRAMQVLGPDNEVLYLTEIKDEVPPFELPFARCYVDRLFIPVAIVPNRAKALAFYEAFDHTKGLQFETKITVISRAMELDIQTRFPVATVQLAGKNLVELDEIPGLKNCTINSSTPPSGIGAVTFEVAKLPEGCEKYEITNGPMVGQQGTLTCGAAGELIELIERRSN